MAGRTTRAVGAGATEANPDTQEKLDAYTASDSRSAEAPEAFPVYTRTMLSRNARSLESEASPSDMALLASQQTLATQGDTKALRDEVAAVKDNATPSAPETKVTDKDKVASAEPVDRKSVV